MRLITIDNGNTFPTVGIHTSSKLEEVIALASYQAEKNDYVLISNVGKPLSIKASFDLKSKRSKNAFFDMPVDYSESLGDDRLISSYHIFKKIFGSEKILIIDAGTFITCDLISSKGFLGGHIFPGINRFLESYGNSAQLPTLKKEDLKNFALGTNHTLPHNTQEAILAAAIIYLQSSLEKIIKTHSPDRIVLTGGSALEIKNLISLKVPFELDHHLIHLALSTLYHLHLSQE